MLEGCSVMVSTRTLVEEMQPNAVNRLRVSDYKLYHFLITTNFSVLILLVRLFTRYTSTHPFTRLFIIFEYHRNR